MPVEGQWDRVNTPLRPIDRRVLSIAAVVAVLVTAGAIAAAVLHPSSHPLAGCVTLTVPSTMGGAPVKSCGAAARTLCLEQSGAGGVAAQCRRLGYATRRQ